MTDKKTGGPVYPIGHTEAAMYASCREDLENPMIDSAERAHLSAKAIALSGMTQRQRLAGKAMQAAISGHLAHYGHEGGYWAPKDIASYAYEVADAMLEAGNA